MKKVLALAGCALMILQLAACSSSISSENEAWLSEYANQAFNGETLIYYSSTCGHAPYYAKVYLAPDVLNEKSTEEIERLGDDIDKVVFSVLGTQTFSTAEEVRQAVKDEVVSWMEISEKHVVIDGGFLDDDD